MIKVNERLIAYVAGSTLRDIADRFKPDADIFIINGFPASPETPLRDGDECCVIKRGEVPDREEMADLLYARHTPGVHAKVACATVGVMGLGGLGSMVAAALVRIGIGRLLLADFDVVEPSNLNRQQYFVDQIGMKKTFALRENLTRMNPYAHLDIIDEKLTEDSIPIHFRAVDVLVECFDNPEMKAAALRAALTGLKGCGYVGASGLAGYADNNRIVTRRLYPKVFIVGDGELAAAPGRGLMAPRVGIAAHHQANQVLRILLGEEEGD